MKIRSHTTLGITAAAICGLTLLPAHAGDSNVLILKQEGTANEIFVDQQNANNSQVGGVDLVPGLTLEDTTFNRIDLTTNEAGALANPATQIGTGNTANITLEGEGGVVFLQQGGQITDSNNDATVAINSGLTGGSFAAILQDGSNNTANATINGSLSEVNVLQQGNSNQGTVAIGTTGLPTDNVRASLTQNGDNNNTELQVTGINAGEYSYTVNGNNTSTTVPALIVTNGASVSITQSTLTSR
ncbi:hypothetical protein [Cohaesibacter intestini]|uniref:hypothetical protein n=1 Tax=Cohaesibacter intestini TaxID=2211145 RepID=UPI001300810D|nr:hypothetical protein [Cohaesibacter intestini]